MEEKTQFQLSSKYLKNLPNEIYSMVSLTSLAIPWNKITDIEKLCRSLVNLKTMNASNNLIKAIPPSISNIQSLTLLNLHNNRINKISPTLSALTNLKKLDLGLNRVPYGEVVVVMECTQVQDLTLCANGLRQIPETLEKMANLKTLDISFNHLSKLPGLEALKSLYLLNINDNFFLTLDALPPSVQELKANYGQFTEFGTVDFKSLRKISISSNYIDDLSSDFYNQAEHLNYLDLSKNLIFCVPDDFRHLKNLSVLDLSRNNIELLPKCLGEYKFHTKNIKKKLIHLKL